MTSEGKVQEELVTYTKHPGRLLGQRSGGWGRRRAGRGLGLESSWLVPRKGWWALGVDSGARVRPEMRRLQGERWGARSLPGLCVS